MRISRGGVRTNGRSSLPTREQNLATLVDAFGHRVLSIPTKEKVPATLADSERIPN
jgi:hypothetical protein